MTTPTTTLPTSAEHNDDRTFQRLIENYFPLVRSIVNRMRQKLPNTIEADELHSIGLSGLVEAARKYQPSREGSFAGYAATRIRGAIQDELRRQDSMSRSNWQRPSALARRSPSWNKNRAGTLARILFVLK
jgi:RNA polymerase sigma factor (sigma-70 family)